jgi:hypothetical protein
MSSEADIKRLKSTVALLENKFNHVEKLLNTAIQKLKVYGEKDIQADELSGDLIDGGVISNFKSTGIKDTATKNVLTVKDGKVIIDGDVDINKGHFKCEYLHYNTAVTKVLEVTESITVDGQEVMFSNRLGNAVKSSKLQQLGILNELEVKDTLKAQGGQLGVGTDAPMGRFAVANSGHQVVIDWKDGDAFIGTATAESFSIGSGNKKSLTVSPDGKIGINIKSPVTDLDVAGDIRIKGKRISVGNTAPTSGAWKTGDIVFTDTPDQFVGWICFRGGEPGTWKAFGAIRE